MATATARGVTVTGIEPVPMWLRGLWKRRSIAWPDGRFDDTTIVYWLQTASAFADIRIPAERPDLRRLSGPPSEAQVRCLARQGGFAGWTELDGNHCRWHRQIDFQPPSGIPDEGRLRWHDGLLIEEGVHEPYVEIWERVAIGAGTARTAPATSADEVLVVCGDAFLYARDRRPPLPIADSLETLLNAATDEGQVARLLDCEISFGSCSFGAIPWQISLSTVPRREGRGLVDGG